MGVDPNIQTEDNVTALSIAIQDQNMELFNFLLENGSEVEVKTMKGLTGEI